MALAKSQDIVSNPQIENAKKENISVLIFLVFQIGKTVQKILFVILDTVFAKIKHVMNIAKKK